MSGSVSHIEAAPTLRQIRMQYSLQLLQVFFVGLTLGMTRTVIPALAEAEFGLPASAPEYIGTFVIAFGLVKAIMNFIAGRLSERLGRKPVLVIGWIAAIPIPLMIYFGQGWAWVIAAMALLGINQGLTWSMSLTSKLDLTSTGRRGLTNGLNEFCGYFAVALAGIGSGYVAARLGARSGILVCGLASIMPALGIAVLFVRESKRPIQSTFGPPPECGVQEPIYNRRRRFFAICQAGHVEKFVDALMWIYVPFVLHERGVELKTIGWVPGLYAAVWGSAQLLTGPLSDRVGRRLPIAAGMLLCAIGVGILAATDVMTWWWVASTITGLGMALLYPTLGAEVSDIAPPRRLAALLGQYRFWRDLGYAAGAVLLLAVVVVFGELAAGFWLVSGAMLISMIAYLGFNAQPRPFQSGHRE